MSIFGDLPPGEDHVRPEIKALIARGNVTPAELSELRMNSWERDALVPALSDEALVERFEHALANCFTRRERPFTTYNQAVEGLYAPELIKRFASAMNTARTYADVIDNVREALGQKATHYLVIADDVIELVNAVERESGDAKSILLRLRAEPGSGNPTCQACSIEAEIGTEVNPHPVPPRFHTCSTAAVRAVSRAGEDRHPTFSYNEVLQILKNSGIDAQCGACAAIAFTGTIFPGDRHTCEKSPPATPGEAAGGDRTPNGLINNCALANRDEEKNCQVCGGNCPDRDAFAMATEIARVPGVHESSLGDHVFPELFRKEKP